MSEQASVSGTGVPIDLRTVRRFDPGQAVPLSELPDETFQNIVGGMERMLELDHAILPDTANHPAYKPYATVEVGGKVVAKLDNNGYLETSNAMGAALQDSLPGSVNGKSGPDLARARAEAIAQRYGGTVRMAPTALTQQVYDGLPKPEVRIDRAALVADPAYERLQAVKRAHTAFMAQQLGQQTVPA